jgi:hypothetical protein
MGGFKSGSSGEDPFGDDADDTDEAEGRGEAATNADVDVEESVQDASSGRTTAESTETAGRSGLPWLYRRSSITDGREKTVQLHLQSSTLDEQRAAKAEVEKVLGESVKKADLREAAVLVGLRHVDEVAAQLREWGYDIE